MMKTMTEKEFLICSRKGNLVPVCREIYGDLETPVAAYMKLARGSRYSLLLESIEGGERLARYSFIARDPELVLRTKERSAEIVRFSGKKKIVEKRTFERSPLSLVRGLISKYKIVNISDLPLFCGGLVGYLSYDTVRFFEKLPDNTENDLDLPDVLLMLVKDIVLFDHLHHTIKIVSCVDVDKKDPQSVRIRKFRQALKKIDAMQARIERPLALKKKVARAPAGKIRVRSNCARKKFEDMVREAKKDITAGEIIQVVLSQRFEVDIQVPPVQIYRTLRTLNPSPYMYLLQLDDMSIVGSSPEMLIRCEKGIAETRPIAGTRPRGKTPEEDAVLKKDLLNDPKEIAEHVMLVDLGRNDLGRVCKSGTVKVTDLMGIELYSHVMHIVSNVQGELKKECDSFAALEAAFPAGTLSGAPKIRAMEIIDRLERSRRGPYGGCIGYFSFSQNLNTCITIRTIVLRGRKAYVQAGAGIVADSDPKKEYIETVNKAKAQIKALELARYRQ